ncbi:MAG: hypothetical protein KKE05_00495, partial [Nanoarchaeota archaeon]|nr:hypothetical protein [Nanoarchaeota archaeon]
PQDLILKRKSMAGQSFLFLEYDGQSAGGLKPEIGKGTPYPQQIVEERKIHIEVAQQAAGDPKNILRGQSPHSGASGVMVDILRESAELSHTPDVERFYRSWNRMKKKQLILAKEYKESRLLKIAGEGNQIFIKKFKGADLHNNTDVRLEIDSGISTTRAGQNEFILNLIRNNFFGDVSMKPEMQYELMRRLGMSWNPVATTVHEDRARMEHSMVAAANDRTIKVDNTLGKPVPVLDGLFYAAPDEKTGEVIVLSHDPYFKYDDDQIHYREHTKYILSKEFAVLPVVNQTLLINHTDIHHARILAVEQQEMEKMAKMQAMKMENEQANKPPPQPSQQTGGDFGMLPAA